MEYRLCAVVESDSTTAQIGFSIANYLELSLHDNSIRFIINFESTIAYIWFVTEQNLNLDHIYWNITSVLFLSQTQRQYKLDFFLHDP